MNTFVRTAVSLVVGLFIWSSAIGAVGAQVYPDHCEPLDGTSSGYMDDEGCPISQADFELIRQSEEGMQWGNIAMVVGVLVVVIGGVVFWRKQRSSSAADLDPDSDSESV